MRAFRDAMLMRDRLSSHSLNSFLSIRGWSRAEFVTRPFTSKCNLKSNTISWTLEGDIIQSFKFIRDSYQEIIIRGPKLESKPQIHSQMTLCYMTLWVWVDLLHQQVLPFQIVKWAKDPFVEILARFVLLISSHCVAQLSEVEWVSSWSIQQDLFTDWASVDWGFTLYWHTYTATVEHKKAKQLLCSFHYWSHCALWFESYLLHCAFSLNSCIDESLDARLAKGTVHFSHWSALLIRSSVILSSLLHRGIKSKGMVMAWDAGSCRVWQK